MKRTTLIFMSTCLFAVFLFAACRGNKKGDDLLKQNEVKIAVCKDPFRRNFKTRLLFRRFCHPTLIE